MFLAQREHRAPLLIAYKLLRSTVRAVDWRIDKRSWVERAEAHWRPYQTMLADRGVATPTPTDSRLFHAYAWTDGLATYYGLRYRNTAIRNFMLSAVAVFFALVGLFDPDHRFKPWFVAAELLVIGTIVITTVLALRAHWHERWTDYRGLGERLRLVRVLGLVGSSEIEHHDRRREPPRRWASWYYAAIVREIDLPNHRVDKSYLRATLDTLRAYEIEGQLTYHRRNFEESHRLTLVLELVGLATLAITLMLGFWYLYQRWWLNIAELPSLTMWVTFIAGLFPAIGAASLGIREQGELGRRRNLSIAMYDRLRRLRAQLRWARRSPSLPEVSRHRRGYGERDDVGGRRLELPVPDATDQPAGLSVQAARVTRFAIDRRTTPAFGGREFGAAGAYEVVIGRAHVALDPRAPQNAAIVGLDMAPVNADGAVEYGSQVAILKPIDLARGSGGLVYEVINRSLSDVDPEGRSMAGAFNLVEPVLERGDILVAAAWQGEIQPDRNNPFTKEMLEILGGWPLYCDLPPALEDGRPAVRRVCQPLEAFDPFTGLANGFATLVYPAAGEAQGRGAVAPS